MEPKRPAEQPKKLPPQVEQMLASAKEMEAVLTKKLALIDVISQEKSEMAKQEATKIKSDVEEIKRLSLVQTKEGEEALRAKIIEVNQRIEATTRKAAELQIRMVQLQQELYSELKQLVITSQKMVKLMEQIPSEERTKFIASTSYMVIHAGKRLSDMQQYVGKLETMQHKMDLVENVKNLSQEEAFNMLSDQVSVYLEPSRLVPPTSKGLSMGTALKPKPAEQKPAEPKLPMPNHQNHSTTNPENPK